jgi:hypothetical protein
LESTLFKGLLGGIALSGPPSTISSSSAISRRDHSNHASCMGVNGFPVSEGYVGSVGVVFRSN